jgi:hypothetical protein
LSYNAAIYREQGSTALVVGSSGKLRFEGSGCIDDTGKWDDLRVPMSAVRLPGLQAPGFSSFIENTSILWFDAGTEESAYFACQIPHDWKPQSDLEPHLHWCTTAASTDIVRWGLEYSIAEINSTMSAATTLHTTSTPSGDRVHQLDDYDSTIDMSGAATSAVSIMLICRLFRDSSNAADTYAADAGLFEFDFHYQKSRLGSTAENG